MNRRGDSLEQATGEWVRLVSFPKSGRKQVGTWHRHDGKQTRCGFQLFDRAVFDDPPPGAKTCRFCELAVGE